MKVRREQSARLSHRGAALVMQHEADPAEDGLALVLAPVDHHRFRRIEIDEHNMRIG